MRLSRQLIGTYMISALITTHNKIIERYNKYDSIYYVLGLVYTSCIFRMHKVSQIITKQGMSDLVTFTYIY